MTERKPPGISFRSWIDQQIQAATDRGAFDNLAGSGKPLPYRGEDAAEAWIRDYARREGLPPEEMLPTPLRLRKEASMLAETAPHLATEAEVRQAVAELNERIMKWRRLPLGPPIFVPLVDEDQLVSQWRDQQAAADLAASPHQRADVVADPAEAAAQRPGRAVMQITRLFRKFRA